MVLAEAILIVSVADAVAWVLVTVGEAMLAIVQQVVDVFLVARGVLFRHVL